MLTGERVGLRAIERADLSQLLAWRNNPAMRRFFREYRELGMDQQLRWYEQTVLGDPSTRMFAIVELEGNRSPGRLLGACGLCYIHAANRSADFSIYLGADGLYIDEAFAPDAARTLMRYGFDELNLHRLWAEIYDNDAPKRAFFDALGFRLDGTQRQTTWRGGRWHDSLFFSMLEPEYRAMHDAGLAPEERFLVDCVGDPATRSEQRR